MGRRALFTDDEIQKAIDVVRSLGRQVTPFSVRAYLGGGNQNRIREIIEKVVPQIVRRQEIYGEINEAVDELMDSSVQFRGFFEGILRRELDRANQLFEKDKTELREQVERLERDVLSTTQKISLAEQKEAELNAEIERLKGLLADSNVGVIGLGRRGAAR